MSDGSVLLDGSAVLDVEYGGRAILSVDGSRLLTTHGLALVDAATAEVEWRTGRPAVLTSAAWSESLFAVGYFNDPDYLAQVYDWRGNTVYSFRESTWVGASAPVQVEITPDGKHLVTVTHEGFRVWDLATGEPVGVPITHDGWVTYRAFSADSRLLAGAFGSTVLVWDIETGDLATEPIQYPQRVKALLFHPTDPDVLAVQSVDRTVRLWDVSSAAQYKTLATYPGGTGAGNFSSAMVAFSPTAPLVAASSQRDPAVVITNVTTGLREGEPLMHGGAPNLDADPWGEGLNAVVFSPDGSQLAVADWGRGLYLWDVDTATLAVPVQEGRAVSVAFAPDGSKLAWLAGRDLSVWDMGPGEPTTIAYWDLGLGSVGDPGGVDFNAFGDRIVLVTHQGQATVFRTEGMVQVGRQMRMDGRSDCARWSPDDTLIVTSSEDSSAQLWDASTQRPAGPPLRHGGRVRWANFSSDGRYVGTASDDMTAQLWDVATGKRVALPMRHTSAVLCIEFSPDGRYVATAAAQDARLWELPRTPDTLAEVQRKTWLATGTRLTDEGAVESLGWQEWQALRVDAAAP
jgi:WD40 repeat protein